MGHNLPLPMCTAFNTVLPYTQRLPMVQILQWLTTIIGETFATGMVS